MHTSHARMQRLYALAAGRIREDNPDSLVNQEALLPGHLWGMIFKEKLQEWLTSLRGLVDRELRRAAADTAATSSSGRRLTMPSFEDDKWIRSIVEKTGRVCDVGAKLNYFLSTGNLRSESGLDLQQSTGFTIVAERLNFWRFISHFRSIHRGAFFAQLRTTTVRKLLPDSWGFLCPVHTPDGSPFGLLNHLAYSCKIVVSPAPRRGVIAALVPLLLDHGAILMPHAASLPVATYLVRTPAL